MTHKTVSLALGLVCIVGLSGTAKAGGIFIPGAAPQAQARAGAFVAKADDPSALFHNPAGFAKGTGTVILLGANFVNMSLEFARAGNYETSVVNPGGTNPYPQVEDESTPAVGIAGFQAVPIIAVTTDLGLNLPGVRFGAGLFAPHGYPERDFGEYDFEDPTVDPPPNRYDVQSQDVAVAFPSLGASYSVDDVFGFGELDVGLRLSWGFGGVKAQNYVWAVRNYEEDIGTDGYIDLDTSDNFIPTFGFGLLYRPVDVIEIGFAYSEQSKYRGKGEMFAVLGSGLPALGGVQEEIVPSRVTNCESGGEVGALKACLDFNLPRTASLGTRFIFRDAAGEERGDIELDVKWEDWSNASTYSIVADGESSLLGLLLRESILEFGLKDTWSFRLGGAYSVPTGPGKITLRAGLAYDTEAADVKWNRLNLDSSPRTTVAAGVAWEGSSYRVELGAGAVLQPDRSVPACNPDVANSDCPGFSAGERSPSPAQPLQGPNNQVLSPFNGGDYSSGYVLGSFGVSTWF